jgi:predicted helicase
LSLFDDESNADYIRHDGISDWILKEVRKRFGDTKSLTKEHIFYYVYGILHSEEYRRRYSANLKKELPRIPLAENFRDFYNVGKALAQLHLHYEEAEPYPLTVIGDDENPGRVEKMRWGKKRNPVTGKMEADKSVLVYNNNLTFKGIPEIAHRYVVNGRSPLEWMIDRYQVKTDKAYGIVNDPNLYSEDQLYIVNLIRRLVTVSVETMKIVDAMSAINEMDCYVDFPDAWKVQE